MTDEALDSLKEVASIGVGNSATALSKIIAREVKVELSDLRLVKVEQVAGELGGKEELVTLILVKLMGDVEGAVLYVFDSKTSVELGRILTSDRDLQESALKEMVNILLGSALKAVAEFLNVKILHTIPAAVTDMLGAAADPVIAELGGETDEILFLKTTFSTDNLSFNSFFLTSAESTKLVLEKIREKQETRIDGR